MGVEASSLNGLISCNCRIVVVGTRVGDDCVLTYLVNLPEGARILATGRNLDDLHKDGGYFSEANVLLYDASSSPEALAEIVYAMVCF